MVAASPRELTFTQKLSEELSAASGVPVAWGMAEMLPQPYVSDDAA